MILDTILSSIFSLIILFCLFSFFWKCSHNPPPQKRCNLSMHTLHVFTCISEVAVNKFYTVLVCHRQIRVCCNTKPTLLSVICIPCWQGAYFNICFAKLWMSTFIDVLSATWSLFWRAAAVRFCWSLPTIEGITTILFALTDQVFNTGNHLGPKSFPDYSTWYWNQIKQN